MSSNLFEKAHHFQIGQLNAGSQHSDALKDLCNEVATGALLNSEERSDAPHCLAETRVAVQRDIFSFVTAEKESTQPKRILWLTGPAGSGKTTIMNTVGEHFKKEGSLAAAFFFTSSGSRECKTKGRFVKTIVYQLIQRDGIPGLREYVLATIDKDPTILRMSLKEEMEVLILQSLRKVGIDTSTAPQVILVDGLDECGEEIPAGADQYQRDEFRLSTEQDQIEILDILLAATSDPAFPFQVIIASRPEPSIRRFFSTSAQFQSAQIFLDNKYDPDADIALYLTSHFARIRRNHPHLPLSWPGEAVIATLVQDASQQMIYAATVIRFVETPSNTPGVQLEIVLKHSTTTHASAQPNPFAPLDALYARILESSADPILTIKYLKAHQYLDTKKQGFLTWCLYRLCESSEGRVEHLCANLSALVSISDDYDLPAAFSNPLFGPGSPTGLLPPQMALPLAHPEPHSNASCTFYHKSFQDFLSDPLRYGAFFALDEEESQRWLIRCFISVFENKGPVATKLHEPLSRHFCATIVRLWYTLIRLRTSPTEFYDERLTQCDADWWLSCASLMSKGGRGFTILMYVVAHHQCRKSLPCRQACRTWRKLILDKWSRGERNGEVRVSAQLPNKWTLLQDKFCVKRILLESTDFAGPLRQRDNGVLYFKSWSIGDPLFLHPSML